VLPGFIDTHAHWTYPAPEVAEPDNWSLRANLAYGVTAGLDVQSDHVANFVYQDLVETGQTVGPRAFMVGPGVFGVNNYKPYEADFRSYDETLAYLRRYQQHYRVHLVKAYLSGNRRQRQWVVMACQALGLMVTTEGFGDPVLHLTHAMDGMHGNEHALTDSDIYADVIETFVRTRTTHTSTVTITHYGLGGREYFLSRVDVQDDPKLNRFYPREILLELTARRRVWGRANEFAIVPMAAQAAKIQRAGGLVGVGSHGEVQGLGYHWEMEMLAMGGMTPAEILTAATRDGARIIGFEQDLGTIETGKLADLVVLSDNPLEDIRNTQSIACVMKNGVLYDGETLETL
jgi:imidazolonepropionase-like amidohydrolase